MNPNDILRHELIGLEAKIARAANKSLVGVKGLVIDESKNTLILSSRKRKIMVPKNVATFRFKLKDGTIVEVDGYRLVARPENRLKMKVRRW